MEFKKPENFKDILKLQKHLDKNLNNVREITLKDIKLSLIAEVIEFNEETPESHKTWKTKPYNKEKELEELTDIWFFVAQMVNYSEYMDKITVLEKQKLNIFFEDNKSPYRSKNDILDIIFDVKNSYMDYDWLRFLITDLMILSNQYGYTTQDILKTYWEKWQKNMKRIGKEWN